MRQRSVQRFSTILLIVSLAVLSACDSDSNPGQASDVDSVSLADYRRAERFLAANTFELMQDNILAQYWQDDDRLVYQKANAAGSEFILVDPGQNSRTSLFDAELLAQTLAEFSGEEVDADDLSISELRLSAGSETLEFRFEGDRYRLDLSDLDLQRLADIDPAEFVSPDGSKAVFIVDHNLWVREIGRAHV